MEGQKLLLLYHDPEKAKTSTVLTFDVKIATKLKTG